MVTRQQIEDFAYAVAERYHPERIILFGSQARGTANKYSDVDLLVVLSHDGRNVRKAVDILNAIDPRFPIDLLVRKPTDIALRLQFNDFFMRSIVEKGVVLYESGRR
jgi:predicted nucleotidyltransferase